MEVVAIGWCYERRWIGCFFIPIVSIFIRDDYLQYTNFLRLNDKESVIVSPVITVCNLKKKGEIKAVSVFTKLPSSLFTWRSLNWLNDWVREIIFWFRLLRGKKLPRYKEVLVGMVRIILWSSKNGMGR